MTTGWTVPLKYTESHLVSQAAIDLYICRYWSPAAGVLPGTGWARGLPAGGPGGRGCGGEAPSVRWGWKSCTSSEWTRPVCPPEGRRSSRGRVRATMVSLYLLSFRLSSWGRWFRDQCNKKHFNLWITRRPEPWGETSPPAQFQSSCFWRCNEQLVQVSAARSEVRGQREPAAAHTFSFLLKDTLKEDVAGNERADCNDWIKEWSEAINFSCPPETRGILTRCSEFRWSRRCRSATRDKCAADEEERRVDSPTASRNRSVVSADLTGRQHDCSTALFIILDLNSSCFIKPELNEAHEGFLWWVRFVSGLLDNVSVSEEEVTGVKKRLQRLDSSENVSMWSFTELCPASVSCFFFYFLGLLICVIAGYTQLRVFPVLHK